ncbi:MAG: metallophosphoesterase [Proteobacteria bacterium]|nr:metallophosphoesterase [Pseudomonadota bacterium]
MKLFAISDLHVRHSVNRDAVESMTARPDDWLILAGDLAEKPEDIEWVFATLAPRFAKVFWVPGNHELWSGPKSDLKGVARYEHLCELAAKHGVLTPEDPPALFEGEGGPAYVCPLFLLYDYSFCPDGMDRTEALAWSAEAGLVCTDEWYLEPDPYPSREAWCAARVELTRERMDSLPADVPKVLVNHFPFRMDLVRLFKIPRFVIWCGTKETEDWHTRWNTRAVVHGHLHMRATDWRDGVRFEEVAIGYPRHWKQDRGIDHYVREILPGPDGPDRGWGGPIWHR